MQKKKILVNDKNITPTWHPIFKHPICKTYLHLQKCTSELKEEKKTILQMILKKKERRQECKEKRNKEKKKNRKKRSLTQYSSCSWIKNWVWFLSPFQF